MEIKGSVKSHIQLPRCVLKGFSFNKGFINKIGKPEKHNYVYCLNKLNNTIEEIDIDDANTEFGYYEDNIETVFSQFESELAETIDHIRKNIKQLEKGVYRYDEKDVMAIKNYCSLCWIRSPNLVADVQKKTDSFKLLANQPQNVVAYTYLKDSDIVDVYFNNLNFTVILNSTSINYLLPQCGIIGLGNSSLDKCSVYIPISPKILVLLTTESTMNNHMLEIRQMPEQIVDKFNKKCISFELNSNVGNIYAKNENDIIRYEDYIKSIKKL